MCQRPDPLDTWPLLYEFSAEYAGFRMDHCDTGRALQHVAIGMFGMVIIEPAAGLPSVDKEFAIEQDSVAKEDAYLVCGNDGSWGSQAVDLSPAQGGMIELTPDEDGLSPMVTHAFNLIRRGALGLVRTRDGDPTD